MGGWQLLFSARWWSWSIARMHNAGPAVKIAFAISRVRPGKPTRTHGVKRRNTDRWEAFTSRIRRGLSRIQTRIESFM
jgi:hypothetical protein